ncbi:MAG: hypothetical protein ABSG91_21505 [Syntrophobacteraceae bacterium]
MDVLETVRDLSILGTALIAIYGIDSWRRESITRKKTELAEAALALFYEAEDAIRMIRYPGSYGSEGSTRKPGPNENLRQKEARDTAHVLIERYLNCKKLFNRIHSIRYRFTVQFGKESTEPFDELHKLVRILIDSARRLAEIWAKAPGNIPQEDREKHDYWREKYEAIFWEESKDDEINLSLKSIIRRIENTCCSIILPKPTVHSFIKYPLGKISELIRKKMRTTSKPEFCKAPMGRVPGK